METIHYSTCPLCASDQISFCLQAKDYTVSREMFEIWECSGCSGRFTQDIPTAADIGKYYQASSYISHTDTREGLVNKLYHRVRRITLNTKRKLVQKVTSLKKGRLLDVGAGTGLFAKTMQEKGWQVTALEPDSGARAVAAKASIHLEEPSVLFDLPAQSFDAITMWHVLEHVHELHSYLDQCRHLLVAGGKLIIAVPNYTSADAHHYETDWAAYDVPRHLYHFSPASMDLLLAKHEFKIEKHYAQWFDSFYVSLLSEQYKTGKTKLIKGAWQGLMSNVTAMSNRQRCSSLVYVASNYKDV
jgi:SAM-dependent methyltransferase